MLPKLLVVDDDESILRAMARGLKSDFDVKTFTNAADALREIDSGYAPDAILSDIRMPGMDGLAFREAVAAAHPELLPRFAFCSGSASDAEVVVYLTRHQVRVLPKPATPADVRAFLSGEG